MGIVVTEKTSQLQTEFFKKSHRLIFSQTDMSSVEQDLFALFLCRLAEDDWKEFITVNEVAAKSEQGGEEVTFDGVESLVDAILNRKKITVHSVPRYSFSNNVLCDWFKVKKERLYAVLKKPSERLAARTVGIQDDNNKKFNHKPLFSEIDYKNGVMTMIPNHMLLKEFLCLSKGHAQIPHKQFRVLRGEYSKRIFSMLCRFKKDDQKLRAIPMDDLCAYLGLLDANGNMSKKTYKKINNIIERIIKPAIKEIDEVVSDLYFQTNEKDGTRKGFCTVVENRKITAIEFLFEWRLITNQIPVPKNQLEVAVLTYTRLEKCCDMELITKNDLEALRAEWCTLMIDGFDMVSITNKFKSAMSKYL